MPRAGGASSYMYGVNHVETAVNRWPAAAARRSTNGTERSLARAARRASVWICAGLIALLGWLPPSAATAGTPALQLDVDTIVEYWFWASGVEVTGSGFAATAAVEVTVTDPDGGMRRFPATTDAAGGFVVRVNAMKLRSVLGQHVVAASDAAGAAAQAPLTVIRDPNEVLDVKAAPDALPLAQFVASGVEFRVEGLAPNERVRLNLSDPAENIGELMTTEQLFADADGRFTFVLDPDTQIFGAGVSAVQPVEGVWRLSAHDMSGNQHYGEGVFRMLPDAPSTAHYCAVEMTQAVEPITRVRFGDIDSVSAVDSTAGYEDFTARSTAVTTGSTYPIALQGRAQFAFQANTYTVFVDWNRNGILDDDGEVYSAGALVGSTGQDGMEVHYPIEVPAGAAAGATRMRVLKVWSPSPFALYWPGGACGAYRWGQVEDYTLQVTRSEAIFANGFEEALVAPTVAKRFSAVTVPLNTPTGLTITLSNPNAMPATLSADLVDAFPSGLVSAANASTTCAGGAGLLQTGSSVALQAGATIPANGSCTVSVQVAAVTAGELINTIPAGGLVTDLGSNASPAVATLTAQAPPVAPGLAMHFSPSTVPLNTPTALTITLSNPNPVAATLSADLVDAFPSGLVSAASASTTCPGGAGLLQTGSSVTLQAGATIPADGSCTVSVQVAAVTAGELVNTIPAGGLVTDLGSNASAAVATLTAQAP